MSSDLKQLTNRVTNAVCAAKRPADKLESRLSCRFLESQSESKASTNTRVRLLLYEKRVAGRWVKMLPCK